MLNYFKKQKNYLLNFGVARAPGSP